MSRTALSKTQSPKTFSVGIDLVRVNRVKSWLSRRPEKRGRASRSLAGSRLSRVLTPRESAKFGRPAALKLARYLAAKEAFFKASGCAWLGIEGFKQIEVTAGRKDRFTARWLKSDRPAGQGSFFDFDGHAGAQVIIKT